MQGLTVNAQVYESDVLAINDYVTSSPEGIGEQKKSARKSGIVFTVTGAEHGSRILDHQLIWGPRAPPSP